MAEAVQKPATRKPVVKEEAPVVEEAAPQVFQVRIIGSGALIIGRHYHTAGEVIEVSENVYNVSADDQKKSYGQVFYEAI